MDNKNQILSSVKDIVIKIDDQAEVLLFGSRARGDEKEDSDWDVLILTVFLINGEFKRSIRDKLFFIGIEFGACISSIIINKKDWETKFNKYPLYYEVKKDAILV